jgi:hypothetical protein
MSRNNPRPAGFADSVFFSCSLFNASSATALAPAIRYNP